MDANAIRIQATNFNRARKNLFAVVLFTALNLFLTMLKANVYMLFSATVPPFVYAICKQLSESYNNSAIMVIGIVIAFVTIILYFVFWLYSKRNRALMLAALIFFGLDSIFLVLLILFVGFEASYMLDILFHFWILYYLILGTTAWAKLRNVKSSDYYANIQQTTAAMAAAGYNNNAQFTAPKPFSSIQESGSAAERDASLPLRDYDNEGQILIEANFNGLHISMNRKEDMTELIVDGKVYDEHKGSAEFDYSLSADVKHFRIVGTNNYEQSQMYIYVNGAVVAKKLRFN